MNNAQEQWKEEVNKVKVKRIRFLLTYLVGLIALDIFLYFFGYDSTITEEEKLLNIIMGSVSIFIIVIIASNYIYKKPKYYPPCPGCGKIIYNIEKDCLKKIEYLGTQDKTIYEKLESTIDGKTVYPRGGYSMRNRVLEHESNSTYQMKYSVPLIKRYHIYNVKYLCSDCNTLICKRKLESLEPLDIND